MITAFQLMNFMESMIAVGIGNDVRMPRERGLIGEPNKGVSYKYTEDYPGNAEQCVISKEHFNILPGLKKVMALGGGRAVVKLEHLYMDDDNPRKWIDCVIDYSNEKKEADIDAKIDAKIDNNTFLGIAICAQHYGVHGEHLNILIENLFRLYIEPEVLLKLRWHDSLHNAIYKDSRELLRSDSELLLIEEFMKTIFRHALDVFGISFSIKGNNLRFHPCDGCLIWVWCDKRKYNDDYNNDDDNNDGDDDDDDDNNNDDDDNDGDSDMQTGAGKVSVSFKNIVMERLPIRYNARDDGHVLLALIGTIRSGRHVISAACRQWFENQELNSVVCMVNTNKNLVGVTELRSYMCLEKIYLRRQMRYIEIELGYKYYDQSAIDIINRLGRGINVKVILREIDSRSSEYESASKYFADHRTMHFIACNPRVRNLEVLNCRMTMKEFLEKDYFQLLMDKLRVLGVEGLGDLLEIRETGLLSHLKLERLRIAVRDGDVATLDQLVGIVTEEGFRFLVFTDMHLISTDMRREYIRWIVDLKRRLRKMGLKQQPVILIDDNSIDVVEGDSIADVEGEGVEYSRVCGSFYEVHLGS